MEKLPPSQTRDQRGALLSVSAVLERLRRYQIVEPLPNHRTILALIEEGILDGHDTDIGYRVWEDSLNRFVARLRAGDRRRPKPAGHRPKTATTKSEIQDSVEPNLTRK